MTAGRSAARGLLLAAVLLYALNLRAPITALAPVVDDVRADLGLSAAGVGLLTGIPVLCFALATPVMAVLLGRLGTGRVVAASLVTVLVGTLLRSADGFERSHRQSEGGGDMDRDDLHGRSLRRSGPAHRARG